MRALNCEYVIFVENAYPWRRMCEKCFNNRDHPANFNNKRRFGTRSMLIRELNVFLKENCCICNYKLMKISPAHKCRDRIEEFIQNQSDLMTNQEIPVRIRY